MRRQSSSDKFVERLVQTFLHKVLDNSILKIMLMPELVAWLPFGVPHIKVSSVASALRSDSLAVLLEKICNLLWHRDFFTVVCNIDFSQLCFLSALAEGYNDTTFIGTASKLPCFHSLPREWNMFAPGALRSWGHTFVYPHLKSSVMNQGSYPCDLILL